MPTTPFWDWVMLLLFVAILVFYLLWFIVRLVKRPSIAKYEIADIITAGVVKREKHTYVVFQTMNKQNVAINFMNDVTTADELITELRKVNEKIILPGS